MYINIKKPINSIKSFNNKVSIKPHMYRKYLLIS